MILYDFPASHNCYKVRLFLAILGLSYQTRTIDLMAQQNREPEFLQLNPRGQVPVVVDENLVIWDSGAILVYLARKYGRNEWLPDTPEAFAAISQWLAVAQNELLYGLGRAHWLMRGGSGSLKEARRRGIRGLRVLNANLSKGNWLCSEKPTIADIACYPHVSLAAEAGFSLVEYPHIRRWCQSLVRLSGYVDIWGYGLGSTWCVG